MRYAIELEDVSVKLGEQLVLSNISMQIPEKDFLGIIGPNGGGKTTLLKTILGIIKPVNGNIKILGDKNYDRKKMIGYVPQASLFDNNFPISVLDVVLMARLPSGLNWFHNYSRDDILAAESILDKLDILELKDRQIGQLSGGQLQRVLLARGLAVDPEILLLDEPTASVDAANTSLIYSLLNELNREKTIIVVTHDLAAVSSYFNNLACLNRKLHHHGSKELNKETTDRVYGCPVDLIAHGQPHRVFAAHEDWLDD